MDKATDLNFQQWEKMRTIMANHEQNSTSFNSKPRTGVIGYQDGSPARRVKRKLTEVHRAPDSPLLMRYREGPSTYKGMKERQESGRSNSLVHGEITKINCFKKPSQRNPSRNPSPNADMYTPKEILHLNLASCTQPKQFKQDYIEFDRPFRTDRHTPHTQPQCNRSPQKLLLPLKSRYPAHLSIKIKSQPKQQLSDCSPKYNLKQTVSTLCTISNLKKGSKGTNNNLQQGNPNIQHAQSMRKPHNLSKHDFTVLKQLGSGKFSKVYMVRERKTGFLAAMKCVTKEKIWRENLQNQILRQIKISSYISHPNLITYYGCFDDQQHLYLLYQLGCDGHLYSKLKHHHTFSQEATSFLTRQVLQAVSYLHQHNILHRDIKPQNIVLSHGTVKLCDLGWSVSSNEMRATMCGTPLYASPELLRGEKYDEKIDLWAVGVMAYELYFGRGPFGIRLEEELGRIITDEVVFPGEASVQFKDFIQAILRKNPTDRLSCSQLLKHPFILKYRQFETCQEVCSQNF